MLKKLKTLFLYLSDLVSKKSQEPLMPPGQIFEAEPETKHTTTVTAKQMEHTHAIPQEEVKQTPVVPDIEVVYRGGKARFDIVYRDLKTGHVGTIGLIVFYTIQRIDGELSYNLSSFVDMVKPTKKKWVEKHNKVNDRQDPFVNFLHKHFEKNQCELIEVKRFFSKVYPHVKLEQFK